VKDLKVKTRQLYDTIDALRNEQVSLQQQVTRFALIANQLNRK